MNLPDETEPRRVEIYGRTEIVSAALPGSLTPIGRTAASDKDFLRGFLDAVILSLQAGHHDPAEYHAQIIPLPARGNRTRQAVRTYRGIDESRARQFLMTVLADMLGGPHEYLLPCEAVFDYLKSKQEKSIEGSVESMIENDRVSCSSRYGPVPDIERVRCAPRRRGSRHDRAPIQPVPRHGGAERMSPHYKRPTVLDEIQLDRHAVIEASAGTGKTFTIEHLVIEILLRQPVKLDQILVLTFTERAAGELRQRIRATIEKVLFNPCLDEHCALHKRDEVWLVDDQVRRKLSQALYAFDAAAIGTIHGFFGRVLAEHAFSTGRCFEGELADGRTLFGRAFKNALRRSLAVKSRDSARLMAIWVEQHSDQAIEDLENLLYDCHSTRRQIEPAFSLEALEQEIANNSVLNSDLRRWPIE